MRLYTPDEERRIRLQRNVTAWARAGLLDDVQAQRLAGELRVDLKRTNIWLRAVLGLFTAGIVAASVVLAFLVVNPSTNTSGAVILAMAAALCFAIASYLIGSIRVYRYGAEEALAACAILLTGFAAFAFFEQYRRANTIVGLLAGSAASFLVYRRFGFIFGAVGTMVCVGLLPFQFDLATSTARTLAAAVFAAAFTAARARYRATGDDFPGDEYATLEGAACALLYLSLNLRALDVAVWWLWRPAAPSAQGFYWATYAATWLIPTAALYDAIRAKDRTLLTVGIAVALATFVTSKPYLGWPRQTWDPMILGALLVGGVVWARRWLAAGDNGLRNGYTAAPILETDRSLIVAAANVSTAWHGRLQEPPRANATPSGFEQGRSGGAGGGATF